MTAKTTIQPDEPLDPAAVAFVAGNRRLFMPASLDGGIMAGRLPNSPFEVVAA